MKPLTFIKFLIMAVLLDMNTWNEYFENASYYNQFIFNFQVPYFKH